MSDLGEVTRTGDTAQIVFRRRYARAVEKVWAALTVPERLSTWFAQTKVDRLEAGGTLQLDFPEENYRSRAKIEIYEPMRTFAWTWTELDGSNPSLVRWDLEPDGDGTLVTLTHSGLPLKDLASVGPGWHTHLQAIEDAVDGIATPWSKVKEREALARPLYAEWQVA